MVNFVSNSISDSLEFACFVGNYSVIRNRMSQQKLGNNGTVNDLLIIELTIGFDIINILNTDRNRVPVVMSLMLMELETMMMFSFWTSFFSVV